MSPVLSPRLRSEGGEGEKESIRAQTGKERHRASVLHDLGVSGTLGRRRENMAARTKEARCSAFRPASHVQLRRQPSVLLEYTYSVVQTSYRSTYILFVVYLWRYQLIDHGLAGRTKTHLHSSRKRCTNGLLKENAKELSD